MGFDLDVGLDPPKIAREDADDVVDADTIRRELFDHGADCGAKARLGLQRQPVDSIEIGREELREMQKIVHEIGGPPEEQASLVAEMAAHRNEHLGVTEDYLSTREFKKVAAEGDAERLLHCLFAVTAADDTISLVEEEEVRQVANELGVEPARYTAIRSRFREKRSVLRPLPED